MSKPLQEALLEALRLMVLSIIPIAITNLQNGGIDLQLIGVTAAITLLRFTDKLLHSIGKENGDERLSKGLTQF
jgi:hypothetical protein